MNAKYFNAIWALDPVLHSRMLPVVIGRMAAGKDAFVAPADLKMGRPQKVAVTGKASGLKIDGNVMVIGIDGVMTRSGDFCSYGTEQLSEWVTQANADPSVDAILLKINSGGGDVDGTEQLARKVAGSKKPILAYVAGTAASAAYWVASQAAEIMMESATTANVGSIGVLGYHVNAKKAIEAQGYEVAIIRADGSEDKALWNSIEPLTAELVADAKTQMNVIRETFVAAVQEKRSVHERVFTGKMYNGKQAIKEGLADRVGDFEMALSRAMVLAKKKQMSVNNNNDKNKIMEYPNLMLALGASELPEGLADETAVALEASLVELNTRVSTRDERIAELEGSVSEAQTTAQTAQDALAAYEALELSVAEVQTLKEWKANADAAGVGGGKDANQQSAKVKSKSTEAAKAYRAALLGDQ